MYEICRRRRDDLVNKVAVFDMSDVYQGNNNVVDYLNEKFNINIPIDQANDVFDVWYRLHWNYDSTDDWKWNERYRP
jgi:hypothetical protein